MFVGLPNPRLCLQGRRLKEQQDMAAAVIQRCYRKYKQVCVEVWGVGGVGGLKLH